MRKLRSWFIRLFGSFRQNKKDREFAEEMKSHLAMHIEDNLRLGMSPKESRRNALIKLGGMDKVTEEYRDRRGLPFIESFVQDIHYGFRSLRHNPGFTAAAVLTIALAVGLNAGIFSVLNGVLFRDLPAPDAHELVSLYQTMEGVPDREGDTGIGLFSTSEFHTYRDRTQTLSGIMAYSSPTRTTLSGEISQAILGTLVTCNYFEVLHQPPVIGRSLTSNDCKAGADPVVVLDNELWTQSFGADPGIVGRVIMLNRQPFAVVGIASKDTYSGFIYKTSYYAPVSAQPLLQPGESENVLENDNSSWLFLIGRRNKSVNLNQVRAELKVIASQIDQQQPGRLTTLDVDRAMPLSIPQFRRPAMVVGAVILTAFGLILLLACANVANLLMARATSRRREIAVRISIGASRARVIRQLLTESMLMSIIGGFLGSILFLWSFQILVTQMLPSFSPPGGPQPVFDTSPDFRVMLFALALTLGTTILFGLAPALHLSRLDLNAEMKQDTSGSGSFRRSRLQTAFVGVQVALCMVLMIVAGLLLRGLYATQTIDPGFSYQDVSYMTCDLTSAGYDPEEAGVFWRRLIEEIKTLPGVDSVAYAFHEPLHSGTWSMMIHLPDQDNSQARHAEFNAVSKDYFSLIDIPILRGRTFTDGEIENNESVAVITETTARNYWPNQDPIGETLVMSFGLDQESKLRIVGIARDAQVKWLGQIDPYYVYLPAGSGNNGRLNLLVRSRIDFGSTASGIRALVQSLDPGIAVSVIPLEANIDYWRNLSATVTTLAISLGILALVLASVGIYGVVSYYVKGRFREIGIRIALGAKSNDVIEMILKRTMTVVIVSSIIGIAAAVEASGILSSVLFGVSPVDFIALGGAVVFTFFVAFLSSFLPARRAAEMDPASALRTE